jgi:hypothetical protein
MMMHGLANPKFKDLPCFLCGGNWIFHIIYINFMHQRNDAKDSKPFTLKMGD